MWLDIELAVPHEGGQHDEHWAELLADDEAARGFAGEVAREKGEPQHRSQRRWLVTCTGHARARSTSHDMKKKRRTAASAFFACGGCHSVCAVGLDAVHAQHRGQAADLAHDVLELAHVAYGQHDAQLASVLTRAVGHAQVFDVGPSL